MSNCLIELLGSPAGAGQGDFLQPLTAMAGVVNVPARAGNCPAAIQRFETVHDSGKIFDHGQITSGQFPQHAYAGLAVVDRLEVIEA